jgi:hypothetical protein
LRVEVAGRPAVTLPVDWRRGANARAAALVEEAFARLRRARSLRLQERVASEAERGGAVRYLLRAPDRMSYRTANGTRFVLADDRQWFRPPGVAWQGPTPLEVAFRTANWLRSPIFVQGQRLLRVTGTGDERVAVVAYMDSGTPGWGTAWIDLATKRVRRVQMLVENHVIEHRYSHDDEPVEISLPSEPNP